ncbi:MAG: 5'-nucleotidase [Pseudomonadales bacterium]
MVPRNKTDRKLVVAISSSALFDLQESDRVYREQGVEQYAKYQIAHEDEVLNPGVAFNLVTKLLRLNSLLEQDQAVEVILLSRNTADTGLRVFNSIQHYGLPIIRAAFTGGAAPYPYMAPFGCHLFLSTNPDDVREALANGSAAASILPGRPQSASAEHELKFAFDGDAVLFSDEAERIYQEQGLEKFQETELAAADQPLPGGPFKPFLAALHKLQAEFTQTQSPIRTALVTARSAPAHERVIKTLRDWDIRLDESMFLGGMKKSEFLKAYGADVFFDDQAEHCASASEFVATGHVLHGVTNVNKP